MGITDNLIMYWCPIPLWDIPWSNVVYRDTKTPQDRHHASCACTHKENSVIHRSPDLLDRQTNRKEKRKRKTENLTCKSTVAER